MQGADSVSRSVSNSLSASGRKRVIKRVVIKKVRQPSPVRSTSAKAANDAFDQLISSQSPYFSPIRPARTSSNDRSRSRSHSPAAVISQSDLKMTHLQAESALAARTLESSAKVPAAATKSQVRARSSAASRYNAPLTPNRYGVRAFDSQRFTPAAELTSMYKKSCNAESNALRTERSQNAALQEQIDLLCDRELYERQYSQIESMQRENAALSSEIATLKRQLLEREKAVDIVTKPDQFGVSLIEKLHQEIRFLNKENLSLKRDLKQARGENQKYEKREISMNMQIPEFFYKLTGESVGTVDEAVSKFARMHEDAIQHRIQNDALKESLQKTSESAKQLRAEREAALRTLESAKERYEAELSAERARTRNLERQLAQFSVDYEQLIKEYKNVVVAADSAAREENSSFDFDALQA